MPGLALKVDASPYPKFQLDALFAPLLIFTVAVLTLSGTLLLRWPVSAPARDFEHVEYLSAPLPHAIRWIHVLAVSSLFGLIYLRLFCALFSRNRSWIVLGWSALLAWSMLLSVTGEAASGTQANFWFSTVIVSVALDLNSLEFTPLSEWLYWHLNSQGEWTIFHAMLAGMALIFMFSLLIGNVSRIAARLRQLTWIAGIFRTALLVSLIVLIIILMSWPEPFNNPENAIAANRFSTPSAIIPDWYLAPWFEMIRNGSNRHVGSAIFWVALVVPILTSAMMRGRPYPSGWIMTSATILLAFDFIFLAILGRCTTNPFLRLPVSCLTAYYFLYFLVIVPALSFHRSNQKRALIEVPEG